MKRTLIFFLVLFLGISAKQALASTYYVSTSGSDTNSGTQSLPFKTFAKAVSVLHAGDILKIFAGTYNERLLISTSGSASGHIQIMPASSSDHVVIDTTSPDQASPIVNITGNYIDISGFEVMSGYTCVSLTGQYSSASNLKVHDCIGNGLYTDGQHNVFDGNTVYLTNIENQPRTMTSGWGSAIKLRVGANDITVKNNTVYQNWGEGIAATRASNVLIENNRVYDDYSVGIYVDNSFNIKVNRNFSYCMGNSAFYRNGAPMASIAIGEEYYDNWGAQLANVTITNNITAFCNRGIIYYGSDVSGGLDGALIANNTLWGSIKSSISITYDTPKSRNIEVANNIFQQSSNLSWIENNTVVYMHNNFWSPGMPADPGSKGANDLSGDPKIVGNPSSYDPYAFRLQATSPVINKGVQIASITTDYENKTRDSLPDIGAFEYGAATVSPTPLASSSPLPSATQGINFDLNNDGVINGSDLSVLLTKYFQLPITMGDFNGDSKVNSLDFGQLLTKIYQLLPTPSIFVSPTSTPLASASPNSSPTSSFRLFNDSSAFNTLIPSTATYTLESRIGSFRQVYEDWSAPIYRVSSSENPPLVTVINDYSGRTEYWPIPTYAQPAIEADHHMSVWFKNNNVMYEFWNARWNGSSTINAGGMKDFPISGSLATGISNPTNQTVVAAGFAVTAGMLVQEDFEIGPNLYNPTKTINHALTMGLNYTLLKSGGFVPPAVGAESGTGDIPLGARYALPRNTPVETLNVHPLARAMLQAARDYGIYVNDHSSPSLYQNQEVGTIRVEPAMCPKVFNATCDNLMAQVQADIYSVVQQYKLYRVTGITY